MSNHNNIVILHYQVGAIVDALGEVDRNIPSDQGTVRVQANQIYRSLVLAGR